MVVRSWRRVVTARDYAARFGLRATARHVGSRLGQDVRRTADPVRARLSGPRGLAPHLPGIDPRWAASAARAMRAAATAPDGMLPAAALERGVIDLAALVGSRPHRDDVTVVIAGYQQTAWLLACLRSIATDPCGGVPPVILVDDASPSVDLRLFASVPNVTVLRNDANVGYVGSVNRGAAAVATPFLVTVNQDVVVAPGWLDALVAALDRDPLVGVAGPRVLDSRLRISEAGGLVFRDGSAANRGRGLRADDPAVARATDVDYVSGCCLAIRRATWEQLDGLDERFAPAYYDDADLCVRVREAGLRVRYVPASVVLHAEGTSMGRDPDDPSSPKHLQVLHQGVFRGRHGPALDARGDRPIDPSRGEPPSERPWCLLALGAAPLRARDGGSVEAWALIGYLQELGWEVLAVLDEPPSRDALAQLQHAGVLVHRDTGPGLLRDQPVPQLWVSYGFAGGRVAHALRARAPRAVAPHVHLTCDVATRRLESFLDAGLERDPAVARWYPGVPATTADTWQAESAFLSDAECVVFVTDEDLAYARSRGFAGPARVHPVMRHQAVGGLRDPLPEPVVGFVGSMSHGPNVDAVRWFLTDVWPRIRTALPRARFEVHGSGLDGGLRREIEAAPGARAIGAFGENDDVYARMRVAVAPVRLGAGLNTKVLDAILHATPVVGTDRSFEGMSAGCGVRASGSVAMADAVVRLLVDDDAWRTVAAANRAVALRDHTERAERARLDALLRSVGVGVAT